MKFKSDRGWCHFQSYRRSGKERYVVIDMPHRQIECHRTTAWGKHVGDHGVHIVVIAVGSVFGELPYHYARHTVEETHQPQLPEDALYLIYRLGYILDEEYGVLRSGEWGYRCACQIGYHSQISAE